MRGIRPWLKPGFGADASEAVNETRVRFSDHCNFWAISVEAVRSGVVGKHHRIEELMGWGGKAGA